MRDIGKLLLCLIKCHAMMMYGKVEDSSILSYHSALDATEWSTSCPSHLVPGNSHPGPIKQETDLDAESVWTY
jgi:hypothetical protein